MPDSKKDPQAYIEKSAGIVSLIATATVIVYAIYLCAIPNEVTDVWWQLRLGDTIRIHHVIPTFDTYSWSAYHNPIILHEWGSCLAFAEAYRHLGGWRGVLELQVAMACLTFYCLFRNISYRNLGAPILSLFLTLLAGSLFGTNFTPRPQIFTYLFLTVSLNILFHTRALKSKSAGIYVLFALVQIFWANMHAAAPIFILICCAYAVGDGIEAYAAPEAEKDRWASVIKSLSPPLACALITVFSMAINPNGLNIYHIITNTVGNKSMPSVIDEWKPINFHSSGGHQVEFFLIFIALMLASTKIKRRPGDILAISLLSLAAIYSMRNVPVLALAATPMIAPYCSSALSAIKARLVRAPRGSAKSSLTLDPALLVSCTFLLVFVLGLVQQLQSDAAGRTSKSRASLSETIYMVSRQPEDACRFIEAERFPESYHMYNDYDSGAYIIWRMRQHRVFVSSETDAYFGKVLDDYVKMEALPFNWRDILAQYNPDFVLMGSDDRQSHLFLNAPDWALVYTDGDPNATDGPPLNLIFVRRRPGVHALIERCRHDCPAIDNLANEGYAAAL